MIDFSAIEDELDTVISSAVPGFVSREKRRIRELVPITQMPSCDIATQGHSTQQDANRTYTVPVICVIRRTGVDRADNAGEFKDLVELVCAALEAYTHPGEFDAIRVIRSEIGEYKEGNGALVRTVVIQFNVLAH